MNVSYIYINTMYMQRRRVIDAKGADASPNIHFLCFQMKIFIVVIVHARYSAGNKKIRIYYA